MASTRSVSLKLSLALLVATTAPASAGFVWLSPDGAANNAAVAAPIPAPASVSVVAPDMNTAPIMSAAIPAPAPMAAPVSPLTGQPLTLGLDNTIPSVSAPVMPQPMDVAPMGYAPAAVLTSGTMAATPIYSAGDQTSTTVAVPAAPAPSSFAPAYNAMPVQAPAAPLMGMDMPLARATEGGVNTASGVSVGMPSAESIISGMTASPATTAPVSPISGVSIGAVPAPAMQSAPVVAQAPVVQAPVGQPMVTGFGRRVPLVVALRQIIPAPYSYSSANGIDLSQLVDWQGGKVWTAVLSDTLRPLGITPSMNGNIVVLSR